MSNADIDNDRERHHPDRHEPGEVGQTSHDEEDRHRQARKRPPSAAAGAVQASGEVLPLIESPTGPIWLTAAKKPEPGIEDRSDHPDQ